MKIVIDIPEKIYNRYINYTESYIDFVFVGTEKILVKAIRNGTPLPKAYWIERFDDEDKWLECSNCHNDSDNAYKYCPNCRAEMESD